MHNYDNRQFQLMKYFIAEFENKKIRLDQIIKALDGLLNSLLATEKEWIDEFQSEWWTLEELYAVALDHNDNTLDKESEDLIYKALENMKKMLDNKLQS